MWQSAARHCSRFGLIRCVVLLTGVQYLQQNTSSQTTKTNKPVTRTAVVLSPVLVVFPLMSPLMPPLPLLMMMFPFSPFGLVLHFARDSAVISSVSVPRIFGSVCARSLWSPHFKNPSSQVLITPPDVWWMLPLGAALSLSLSHTHTLPLSFYPPLLSFSSLRRSYSSPPDTKPCLIHLSSPMSPRPNHLRSHFISPPFFPPALPLCSAPFVFFFSLHVLSPSLSSSFSQTLPAFAHMHTLGAIARTPTRTHTQWSLYISSSLESKKSLNALPSPET